jgi:steroid delta-isomerase-like uncharacterized protein
MSAETQKSAVRRLISEAQVAGKLDVVDELLADDFVDHSPLPGLPPTREGVKMLFAGMRAAFPDLQIRVDEQVADGEKVVTRKTFQGTHRGEFIGIAGTGRPINFEVIDVLTFRGERIAEHRVVFDRMTLMQQLGAMG